MKRVVYISKARDRKLYCTLESRHLPLKEVVDIIDEPGVDLTIIDKESGKDVTYLYYLKSMAWYEQEALNKARKGL